MSTLVQVIAALPEEERVVLTLFYLRSKTLNEIAGLLQVPESAVAAVLTAGRTRLTSTLVLSGLDSQR
jgi:RNA polymerase sigma factor (sigma-70 family)